MKNKEMITKINILELHIYKIIGIVYFKKAILLLEGIIHKKDGKYNENYHLRDVSINTIKMFKNILMYNGLIHIMSLIFLILYFALAYIFDRNSMWINIILCIAAVINIYCIMLQRYIALKIKKCESLYQRKKDIYRLSLLKQVQEYLQNNNKEEKELFEEFLLISRIKACVVSQKSCFLSKTDAFVLSRIAASFEFEKEKHMRKDNTEKNESPISFFDFFPGDSNVVGKVERRIAGVQHLFHIPERKNILFGFCMITESSECEIAYKKIFKSSSIEEFEIRLNVLEMAYHQRLDFSKKKRAE